MATRRQYKRKLKKQRVNLDNLAPKIAEGITVGASAREALEQFPVQGKVDGAELVQSHLGGEQAKLEGTRIPVWRAVLADDTNSVWHDEPTGRLQRNVIEKIDRETFNALQAGYICLRCHEPHPEPFPFACDLCGYSMRERQVMDIAMEFRGMDHIGPGAPIAEYLAEQDERLERLEHAKRKEEGASPMQAVTRRILSPGAKKLRGLSGRVHADAELLEKAVKKDGT